MDEGLVLCDVLAGRRMRETPAAGEMRDGGGHGRPFYRGLVAYAVASALHRTLEPAIDEDAEMMTSTITGGLNEHVFVRPPGRPDYLRHPAPDGLAADGAADVAADLWDALAMWRTLSLAGIEGGPAQRAGKGVDRVVAAQRRNGAYFRFDAGDNPEPWWYHELVVLHAVTSYALLAGDAAALASAKRAAAFHHAETQPDHATGQPWAVHAFLLDPDTTPTADLLLLAAGVNGAGGLSAVSRILLADAAVCLSLTAGPPL